MSQSFDATSEQQNDNCRERDTSSHSQGGGKHDCRTATAPLFCTCSLDSLTHTTTAGHCRRARQHCENRSTPSHRSHEVRVCHPLLQLPPRTPPPRVTWRRQSWHDERQCTHEARRRSLCTAARATTATSRLSSAVTARMTKMSCCQASKRLGQALTCPQSITCHTSTSPPSRASQPAPRRRQGTRRAGRRLQLRQCRRRRRRLSRSHSTCLLVGTVSSRQPHVALGPAAASQPRQ